MPVRLSLLLSNELNAQIENVASRRKTSKADVLRKAIALYIAVAEGHARGLRVGLAQTDQALEIEFVGL